MNVTVCVARELFSLGFTYNFYQNNPQKGMIYYYNSAEWIIGGSCDSDFTQEDLKNAKKIGANTFQFFTRNPRGGSAKEIDLEDIDKFPYRPKYILNNVGEILK